MKRPHHPINNLGGFAHPKKTNVPFAHPPKAQTEPSNPKAMMPKGDKPHSKRGHHPGMK